MRLKVLCCLPSRCPVIWFLPVFLLFVSGWYWFESRWDRRLFNEEAGRRCLNVRPQEANEFLQTHPQTQILDVRSAAEFRRGALPGAVNLEVNDTTYEQKTGPMDKERPVLVYCSGGYRSRKAVEKLMATGFTDIRHLNRGYHSWRLAGLPIIKPTPGRGSERP